MLWYKCWLETRWRFLIGLALMCCSAAGVVLFWPKVMELMPLASSIDVGGEIGRRIKESVEVSREYRGYVWSHWFGENGIELATLAAVVLGVGGLLSRPSALFTLSLPISRNRLFTTRAAAGLAELLVLSLIPSLFIPLLSPAVGKNYSIGNAMVHSVCLFIGAAVFFSLALLLSTVFTDLWRPLLMALLAAVVLGLSEQLIRDLHGYGLFRVMRAEAYFRNGEFPWRGLLACAAASAAMLYGAAINLARRDF
jgi:hypothetical protein